MTEACKQHMQNGICSGCCTASVKCLIINWLAVPGRLMADTVCGDGVVWVVPRHVLTCTSLRCTWHEALRSSVCIGSHIYMVRLGPISIRHYNHIRLGGASTPSV